MMCIQANLTACAALQGVTLNLPERPDMEDEDGDADDVIQGKRRMGGRHHMMKKKMCR